MAEAYARTSDPDTSHDAARAVDASRLEQVVLGTLKTYGPLTARGVAHLSLVDLQSITPRFAPLARKGLIRRTGVKRGRSYLWDVTPHTA
jgi:hypothetical protein